MATQKIAAEHLDMTPRQLKNLIDDGVLPQSQRGGIDLDIYRVAYIRHQRSQLHGRKKSNATIDEERKRLISGQADKVELEVDQMSGELIPAEDVNTRWMDKVMSARATMLALPSKLAPVVMSASTIREVEDFAREEIYRALRELEESTRPDRQVDSSGMVASAASDDQRVGGTA